MEFENIMLVMAQDDTPGISAVGEEAGPATGTLQPGDQNDASAAVSGTGAGTKTAGNSWIIFVPLIGVMIFIFWSSSSSQKKEKRKRNEMLDSLTKHDKVQTIGGVIGSVVEIKDTEVILKVDEANNIKMHFSRSAIQQVVSEAGTSSS